MNRKHRKNLLKLADYLEALPEGYEGFRMAFFNLSPAGGVRALDRRTYECGSVACAVGHGPAAGIRTRGDRNWDAYAERAFGVLPSYTLCGYDATNPQYQAFRYMFGGDWDQYDYTAKGAAARIRRYVDAGGVVPPDWRRERYIARRDGVTHRYPREAW